MERVKKPKLVITFFTTTAAMAMESVCDPALGRLIPVPGEIHAGCGLAWCAEPEHESTLLELMKENKIFYEGKRIIKLY
ncbi:MAG: DUF3343 domain-containing protein [Christensenellales bacterium]|jgi:hypothetical protein